MPQVRALVRVAAAATPPGDADELLRDLARTDPAWVRCFVAAHRLSPLSVREATRHLPA